MTPHPFFALLDASEADTHDFEPCCDQPELDEKTSVPYGRDGRCDVYLVCDNCGHEHGIVGTDGVL